MKVVITGSKGLIGRQTVTYAHTQPDTQVLGVDCLDMGNRQQKYLRADLTDFGQTVSALTGADAVVHLAAIANHGMLPSPELFRINVTSTYNVLEAAVQLRIPRVVLASSIQVTRTIPRRNATQYAYFPIDEAHPVDPQHDYALTKQVGEVVADMYARHYGLTVVSLRYGWVMTPEDIQRQFPWPEAEESLSAMYAYCDVRDAARATYLAATTSLPSGSHTVAFIAARDTFVNTPSAEIVKRYFPTAEIRGLTGYNRLVSGCAAERLLGFVPEHSCRSTKP